MNLKARRHKGQFSLIWLDLDQFKEINDSLGHQAGDDLLKKLGEILMELTREEDIIARLGGDEFAILEHFDFLFTVPTRYKIINTLL